MRPPSRIHIRNVTSINGRNGHGHVTQGNSSFGAVEQVPSGVIPKIALWAKLRRDKTGTIESWHSLVGHSANVAAEFAQLLEQPTINARLTVLAGGQILCATTQARLGALAFLHDIGKANRGFRARVDPSALPVGHIDSIAWLFGGSERLAGPLLDRLQSILGLGRMESWFAEGDWALFEAVFAHHVRPWNRNGPDAFLHWQPGPDGDPIADLGPIRHALDRWFPKAFASAPTLPTAPAFHHAFAGLLMLAD